MADGGRRQVRGMDFRWPSRLAPLRLTVISQAIDVFDRVADCQMSGVRKLKEVNN